MEDAYFPLRSECGQLDRVANPHCRRSVSRVQEYKSKGMAAKATGISLVMVKQHRDCVMLRYFLDIYALDAKLFFGHEFYASPGGSFGGNCAKHVKYVYVRHKVSDSHGKDLVMVITRRIQHEVKTAVENTSPITIAYRAQMETGYVRHFLTTLYWHRSSTEIH